MTEAVGEKIRMPPQNLDAEISVLGALMLDKEAIYRVADTLKPEDFYRENHRLIFETMISIFENREPIDILSATNKLKEKNLLQTIGGTAYLAQLINSVASASNIAYHAEIIRKKRILRDIIAASQNINELGYQEERNVDDVLDEAEQKIFSIASQSLQKIKSISEVLEETWERIDRLHKTKGELRGIPTGFPALDNILAGLQQSDLIILASRPSFGKTALALDIARNTAIKHNIPVGIFSLEMDISQVVDRFVAAEAGVSLWHLRTGKLSTEGDDFLRVRDGLEKISRSPIYIDDSPSPNILQIRAKSRRLQHEHGLGLVIIDYLQLMSSRSGSDNRVEQVSEISRSLKGLAKELNVPVLAVAQLSRAVEHRSPSIPRLADLRESGSIEQDSDVVLFIYREDRYKENSDRKNQADILIAKHRNGPLGSTALYFNPEKVSFSSLEDSYTSGIEQF